MAVHFTTGALVEAGLEVLNNFTYVYGMKERLCSW